MPRLLSVEDAATELGLGRSHTYDLLRDGRLDSIKVGRRRLVPVAALDAFVEQERAAQATDRPKD